jgi:hypothetical protein
LIDLTSAIFEAIFKSFVEAELDTNGRAIFGAFVEHLRPGTRPKIVFWSRQHQILLSYLNRQANLAADNFPPLGPRQLTIFPKGADHDNMPLLSIVQQTLHPWVVTISQQPSVRQHQQLLPHYQLVDQGKCWSIRCLAKLRSPLRKWLSLPDHPKIIQDFKEIASLVGKTRQSVTTSFGNTPSLVRQRGLGLATYGILSESYFSAKWDDDVSKVDVAEALSWRGDPHLTCSDWTIVVATSEVNCRTYTSFT